MRIRSGWSRIFARQRFGSERHERKGIKSVKAALPSERRRPELCPKAHAALAREPFDARHQRYCANIGLLTCLHAPRWAPVVEIAVRAAGFPRAFINGATVVASNWKPRWRGTVLPI